MAEIVQTLFGVSPESYQQQQSALADQQALQYAKLTPFQQANYGIGRGAYQLAGALGGEDPELRKISQRQQIASQINPNDPASIERGIVALSQGGDPEGAFMLQAEYRKMQESGALIGQREAAGKASLAQAGRERQQSIPNDIQLAREIANLQEKVSQLTGLPASPERDEALRLASGQLAQLERLTAKAESKKPTTNELTNAENIALLAGPVGSPAYNAKFMAEYNRLTAPKEAKVPRFGDAAERYAKSMFKGKAYDELTDAEAEIVNRRVDAEAQAKAPKIQVDLKDPTATAKASLDVMNKWEQVIKPDVEVAARFKALTSSVALAQAGNPSADGATIFNIGKIYDPSGAVQEGDKNTILGNPSIPQRIQLLAQTVFKGGSLTPDQRADLLKIGNELVKNKENQLKRYQKQYIKKNTALGGDESDIFNPYEGVVIQEIPSGASLIPSDSTGTKSKVGPAIPAAPMAPAKQVRKPNGTPGAVNWKDL
tara:strand:+ start:351 stop:1811 length:1461 start_codon:yes stop_codon:yes gene_type:complete